MLLHSPCHEQIHKDRSLTQPIINKNIISKKSKFYNDKPFRYWWDITPNNAESIPSHTLIEFVKKDSNESCFLPFGELKPYLTKNRQTNRSTGNWGIKVLPGKPNEIAIEERRKKQNEWISIFVKWEKV